MPRDGYAGKERGAERRERPVDRGGGQAGCLEETYLVMELRAIASLALISLFAVAALWVFMFRYPAHPALLLASLGGFLGAWVSALRDARSAGAGPQESAARRLRIGSSMKLARYSFLIGIASFVAFFLVTYR